MARPKTLENVWRYECFVLEKKISKNRRGWLVGAIQCKPVD